MHRMHRRDIDLDPKRRASEFDPSLLPQVVSSKFFQDDPSLFASDDELCHLKVDPL